MRAHVLDENDKIVNTILVESLDFMEGLVDADEVGGTIGDSVVNGLLVPAATPAPTPAPPPPIPREVTMRQARLALLGAGLLDSVDTAIAGLESPMKEHAQIEWNHSATVVRDRPLVVMIGAALGLTSEQLDDLFITAATL